jgi:hypothetical protein
MTIAIASREFGLAPLLPLVFVVIHLACAAGVILELFSDTGRQRKDASPQPG